MEPEATARQQHTHRRGEEQREDMAKAHTGRKPREKALSDVRNPDLIETFS